MSLKDFLAELKTHGAAAARGIGRGASLGTIKYPVAGGIALVSKIMGETGLPFEEAYKLALETISEQKRTDMEVAPIAATTGEIVGGVAVPGSALARAATLPRTLGVGAAQGAVSGFTANEGMDNVAQDVLLGTALGGVGAGAGRLIDKGREKLVRSGMTRTAANFIDDARQQASGIQRELSQAEKLLAGARSGRVSRRELAPLAENAARLRQELKEANRVISDAKTVMDTVPSWEADQMFEMARPTLSKFASKPQESLGALGRSLVQDIVPVAGIGGAGYLGANALGLDPSYGAALGMLGSSRARDFLLKKSAIPASIGRPTYATRAAGAVPGALQTALPVVREEQLARELGAMQRDFVPVEEDFLQDFVVDEPTK